jgi:hypothetical protein
MVSVLFALVVEENIHPLPKKFFKTGYFGCRLGCRMWDVEENIISLHDEKLFGDVLCWM